MALAAALAASCASRRAFDPGRLGRADAARAADIHAREAERRALFFTSLLEPALILTIGVVVMLIVLAVLLPIIEINHLAR